MEWRRPPYGGRPTDEAGNHPQGRAHLLTTELPCLSLMNATGLEKGGIYRHFSAKRLDYAWRETLDPRIHDLDTISNTLDRSKQLVANFVERLVRIRGNHKALFHSQVTGITAAYATNRSLKATLAK